MDSLKAELERKRQEKKSQFGQSKYVKRGDIAKSKLKRLREEEEKELEAKGKKQKSQPGDKATNATLNRRASEEKLPDLSKDEAVRRLRALGQPATLFGEDDMDRLIRLVQAEQEMNVEDEAVGGQQVDSYSELRKEEKERRNAANVQAAMDLRPNEDGNREVQDPGQVSVDVTMQQFEQAAARLAEKLEEEKMPVEDRIQRTLKRFCDEWREDLDGRSKEVAETQSGHQASISFWQNMKWMDPLFERLKKRQLPDDTVAGLWMIVEAMKERNYQYAYEVYLKLAIGNAPWPIGVTSVGIHERSAREKISHVRNLQGQAHIMNDEATRKYLQAIKRLMTFVQRAYPTEPSRSVDFNSVEDPGKGVAGAGSDKQALLRANAAGVGPHHLALAPAPHVLESDGSVKVPTRWENLLKRSEENLKKLNSMTGGSSSSSKT